MESTLCGYQIILFTSSTPSHTAESSAIKGGYVKIGTSLHSLHQPVNRMKVKEFDTNGLIFAYDRERLRGNYTQEDYEKGLRDIMDCQSFSCFPLVNNPRIRTNTNDLSTRATYKNGGGELTWLVRLPMDWEENNLQFFEREKVPHVDENTNLLEAATFLLSPNEDDAYPFVVTVGGTPEHPIALFSLDQLLDSRTKAEIYRMLSVAEIKSPKKDNAVDIIYRELNHQLFNQSKESTLDICELMVEMFEQALSKPSMLPDDGVFHRPNSDFERPEFGRLLARDIMQHACVGIRWNHNLNPEAQPMEHLAAKGMIMDANDFSNLAIYDKNSENPKLLPYILHKNSKIKKIPLLSSTSTLVEVINAGIAEKGEFVAIIKKDSSMKTGEGRMPWPAIITQDELLSRRSLINCLVVATAVEHHLIKKKLGKSNSEARKWTLGSFDHYCNTKNGRQTKEYSEIKKAVGPENVTKFQNNIKHTASLRNQLAHGALRPSNKKSSLSDGISLESFLSVFKLREMLGMNK